MSAAIRKLSLTTVPNSGARNALLAGASVVFFLVALSFIFPGEAAGALRVWLASPTFNHCFLVLPISLFLIWQRRRSLVDARFAPEWGALALALGLGVLWFFALFANVLEARQFIVLTMLQAALLAALGRVVYRRLAAAFLYLYFLVPSGAYLIPGLQAFTARFAVVGLHVLGIPVLSNGAVIEIPAGTFAVAEACAGLRFLVASVAFGVFFAVITYRSWIRRAVFVSLSVCVPIIANGFRALGLIAAAQWVGNPAAALADHLIYGWIFFSLVLVILIFIGQQFSDVGEESLPPPSNSAVPHAIGTEKQMLSCLAAAALSVFVVAMAPLAAKSMEVRHVVPVPNLPPRVFSPWNETAPSREWRPIVEQPSRSYLQSFEKGSSRMDRFVAIYAVNNVVRSGDRDANERIWTFESSRPGAITSGGHNIPARISRWRRGDQRRVVWSYYVVGGHSTSNVWRAKWYQLVASLGGSPCLSAYVAYSGIEGHIDAGAAGDILASAEDVNAYLCRTTKGPMHR